MKTKITIDTPVHVGTGEDVYAIEYNVKNGVAYRYAFQDILSFVPDNVLLDDNFQRKLLTINRDGRQGVSPSEEVNKRLRQYVNYNDIRPMYQLRCNTTLENKGRINLQVKSLNKPYIPGSTVKGLIFNAIHYDIVKNNLGKACSTIANYPNLNRISFDIVLKDILNPQDPAVYSDFISQYHNCLMCADIHFDKLAIQGAERVRTEVKNNQEDHLDLPFHECIDKGQTVEGEFITINEDKVNMLKGQSTEGYQKQLLAYLDRKELTRVMNQYFFDGIEEELDTDSRFGYLYEGMYNYLNSLKKSPTFVYTRIGKNTGYFFKSISYLFKKNRPDFYMQYFYEVFSPVKQSFRKGDKPIPKPDKMPITRPVYFDSTSDSYPGVIRIEFID